MDEQFRMLHDAARHDLLAEAARYRTARLCRRPGAPARLYARLWWASRPRTVTVTTGGHLTTSWT